MEDSNWLLRNLNANPKTPVVVSYYCPGSFPIISLFVAHRVAEFIIYKLREMGKISQEDISLVMQEFEQLDVDQSGTLSISDISLAQAAHPS